MRLQIRPLLLFSCSIGIALLAASPAYATFVYSDNPFVSSDYTFDNVQETTATADPEPLFGNDTTAVPAIGTNQLLFSPPSFISSSVGGPAADQTASLLEMDIVANAVATPIQSVRIDEFGDTTLDGTSASTGSFASIAGNIRITHVDGVAITALTVPIPVDQIFFASAADNGTTGWSLTSTVDVQQALLDNAIPFTWGATTVEVNLDNTLSAFSEGGDFSALIQKNGVIVTVPEPSTLGLMGLGVLGAALSGRRSRTRSYRH